MTLDLRDPILPADAVRTALGLQPHPEGGHFKEIWRDQAPDGRRGASTSILFLLAGGERSHWHRVDAAETWLWQAGSPLLLSMPSHAVTLGPDVATHELQFTIPPDVWQAARSLGAWSLVSCVVAPAFEFTGFELAPPGWSPAQKDPA